MKRPGVDGFPLRPECWKRPLDGIVLGPPKEELAAAEKLFLKVASVF